jgi:hypothetical protein
VTATTETAKVQGKRSPRWAIWQRMTIPCKDGLTYLVRLRVLQTPWFGIYLHDIHEDDGDRDPHNHPWSFLSVVLRGYYTERVYPDPLGRRQDYTLKTHRRLSVHRMGRESAHRIVDAAPGLKTLILTGPRKATWGFFREVVKHDIDHGYDVVGEFVDWQDYERQIGTL